MDVVDFEYLDPNEVDGVGDFRALDLMVVHWFEGWVTSFNKLVFNCYAQLTNLRRHLLQLYHITILRLVDDLYIHFLLRGHFVYNVILLKSF